MRALITLCAAALLFAAGCSKTNDTADNPTPPADQTGPAPMPPADQPTPSDTTTPAAGRRDSAAFGPAADPAAIGSSCQSPPPRTSGEGGYTTAMPPLAVVFDVR